MALPTLPSMSRSTRRDIPPMTPPDAGARAHPETVEPTDVQELDALVRASAGGDAGAFEAFYAKSIHVAFSAARRVAGDAYAEDVLAEAYFQAWRDAARFDGTRGNAIAWIVTIVRTRALDRLRQEHLRHGGLSGAPEFDEATLEDEVILGPDAILEHTEATLALHEAMKALSSNERWCLGLAYFRDHSHSEIAAITGLPLGSVKTHISRSQQKLRASLESGTAVAASGDHSPQTLSTEIQK